MLNSLFISTFAEITFFLLFSIKILVDVTFFSAQSPRYCENYCDVNYHLEVIFIMLFGYFISWLF